MTYQTVFPQAQARAGSHTLAASAAPHRPSRKGLYERGGKRLFDLVLVGLLAAPAVLITALLAALVALDGASPFFGHWRVGRHGRLFRCWKLRSMVPDAESRLAGLLASDSTAAREWAEARKLSRDVRVTRIGRLLRRTSLDELPQLWNVLKGDMSLVGPRPVTEDELVQYRTARAAYLGIRPGITGMWQVRGRNRLSYGERVALDRLYAKEHSLGLDIKVLTLTIPAVLRLSGT